MSKTDGAVPTPHDDAWRRRARLGERLGSHLTHELAGKARTLEAIALIDRILKRPRLARVVLTNPCSTKLPVVLVHWRWGVDDAELRRVILAMRPFMAGYGQAMADFALEILDHPEWGRR